MLVMLWRSWVCLLAGCSMFEVQRCSSSLRNIDGFNTLRRWQLSSQCSADSYEPAKCGRLSYLGDADSV